jgi:DNA-binding HxlR family transcriptional regulator
MKKLCPIIGSIKIIGTQPRLKIIRHLAEEDKSFNDMRRVCEISSRTLSANIKYLVSQQIINVRKESNKKIYFLTQKGKELLPIIKMLGKWGEKWKVC